MGEALFQVKATPPTGVAIVQLGADLPREIARHARSASLAMITTLALLPRRLQRGPSVNDGSFPQRSTSTEVANVVFSLPTKSIGLFLPDRMQIGSLP
jgi:hypothetical protein